MSGRLEGNLQMLWDLETLGITESNEVHEEFVDNITFNGSRYSVKLPWKQGHDIVDNNYELSLSRMKGQVRKLRKEPEVLEEYDSGGISLNDCLHKGPSLNPLLFDILLRFREKRVALIGDIEKAFLNIEVDKRDRDFLRFLWLEDVHDPSSKISVYRFCRVVFGLNASPCVRSASET